MEPLVTVIGTALVHMLIAAFGYGKLWERVSGLNKRVENLERWRENFGG